jgi:hypothetical protein
VRRRREADDHEAGPGVAEAGQGAAPVRVVAVLPALLTRDPFSVRDQARAAHAGDDLPVQVIKHGHAFYANPVAP